MIKVFDDCVTLQRRHLIYQSIRNSPFKIVCDHSDGLEEQSQHLCFVMDNYSFNSLGLLAAIKNTAVAEFLKEYKSTGAFAALTFFGDHHYPHAHKEDLVMLYYANHDWQNTWGGETLFYNDKLTEIVYASPYTPGRIILFTGDTPHTIRSPAAGSPMFRFTVSSFWKKNDIRN